MAEKTPADSSGGDSSQTRSTVEIPSARTKARDLYPHFFLDEESEDNVRTSDPSLHSPRTDGFPSSMNHVTAIVKPRNRFLTVGKYALAILLSFFGLLLLLFALSPAEHPLRTDMWSTVLIASIFLIPALWFCAFEIIDFLKQRKGQGRSKRRWWLAACLTIAAFFAAYFAPSSGASSISKIGDFRDVLTAHDEAGENCIDLVRKRAAYPASTKIGENISSISVYAGGDGVVHTFSGIMHFPNGFGVLSEHSFVCKMIQQEQYGGSPTSDAKVKLEDLKVKEKSFLFMPELEIQPTGDFTLIDLTEVRGIDAVVNPPDEIYILPEYFSEAHT